MSFAVAATVLAVAATPRPAVACSSEQPTFEQAMAGARAVAVVEVDLAANGEVIDGVPPLRILRVLNGDPRPFLAAGNLRTGLCGDTVHYLYGDGAVVIVAFGVPFFDQVIHPSWSRVEDGSLYGSAGTPFGVTTVEGVEAAIRQRFPTPPIEPEPALDSSWLVLVAAAIALAVAVRVALGRLAQ